LRQLLDGGFVLATVDRDDESDIPGDDPADQIAELGVRGTGSESNSDDETRRP
jgi:hypothetical protein